MEKRWIVYLAAVSVCVVFYWAYREWFSWFALMGVLCFPVAALLMSLPAMIGLKLKTDCPTHLTAGQKHTIRLISHSALPAPPARSRIAVTRVTTGETWMLKEGDALPADHCGQLICRPEKARVYDYLGLMWLESQHKATTSVIVRPVAVPVRTMPQLQRYVAASWRPKAGGGFSEMHELRLYRPGDKLNQVHWKLSAKTGKFIVREPMEPEKSKVLLNMELRGTARELDLKFGRLLWMSRHLLETGLAHEIRALTGRGIQVHRVTDESTLLKAIDALLCCPAAADQAVMEPAAASWQYEIGGGADEA